MLEDAGPITSQIQKLVVDHMSEWMANRTPTDVEMRRELESVFSLLHYPEVALPAAFALPWKGQIVIGAGYTLGWTDFDRQNVVAIFTSSAGKSHLVTVTNFIPRTDLHYTNAAPARLGRSAIFRLRYPPREEPRAPLRDSLFL